MIRFILLSIFFLIPPVLLAQQATIIHSPDAIPQTTNRIKIFLAGSIDMGQSENWQRMVEKELADEPVVLLNPRRDDWNKDWKPVMSDSNFRVQVDWELNALEKADLILMYFDPKSQSPVTLLELGLYARSNKLMVVCPEGFWRKGNVDIVCKKYNVDTFPTLPDLLDALRTRVAAWDKK